MFEITPLLIAVMAFGCVALIVFGLGRYITYQASMQRRLPVSSGSEDAGSEPFYSAIIGRFDEKQFGIEGQIRTKLRRDLIRAGYFSKHAIQIYIFVRLGLVLILPAITYIFLQVFYNNIGFALTLGVVAVGALIAVLGPDFYIARRQRSLQHEYRMVFPDLLDMLVVCTDAGLSLDAAFIRIQPEVSKQSRCLGINLAAIGAETRAGRSTADALSTFADRLNLDEARAFTIMLRQSLELGTDVGEALRVFSNEMRNKRLLRAEETANKLPVKMVLPLGGFIFPVILGVVLIPVIVRLLSIVQQTSH